MDLGLFHECCSNVFIVALAKVFTKKGIDHLIALNYCNKKTLQGSKETQRKLKFMHIRDFEKIIIFLFLIISILRPYYVTSFRFHFVFGIGPICLISRKFYLSIW